MIITEEVEIIVVSQKIKYYKQLGYDGVQKNAKIKVKIDHLSKGSNYEVLVGCDNCGGERTIKYQDYNKVVGRIGDDRYHCFDCRSIRTIETNNKKYGVDNVFQVDLIRKKADQTIKERYGVDNAMQNTEVSEKAMSTNFDRYGVRHPLQHGEFMEKSKETCLKNHGVESFLNHDKFKEISKKSCLEKYGYDRPCHSKQVREKTKNTRIKIGIQIPDSEVDRFTIYRREVDSLTKIIKDKLFEEWDGFDYYDGEYIKDCDGKSKPTIDHKISAFYGYINNISTTQISQLDNLCITKMVINSSKNKLTEEEFKIKKKED